MQAMAVVAMTAIILGLFASNPEDYQFTAVCLIAALVIVVPVHCAIEGNRRDATMGVERDQTAARDDRGPESLPS